MLIDWDINGSYDFCKYYFYIFINAIIKNKKSNLFFVL